MSYFDIHVNDGVNSYSTFIEITKELENPNDADITGIAVDLGKLDPDDIAHVDNVTEINHEEYQKAINA